MGDAGAVVPISAKDSATVGRVSPAGIEARVKSFEEKQLLAEFQSEDWSQREVAEVYTFLRSLKEATTIEPQGVRAQPLPQSKEWEVRYPVWFRPFTAGQLFVSGSTWESVFAKHDEAVPGRIKKWIQQGYSVWLNINQFGRQPRVNNLSEEERCFALKQAREWVAMKALDEVPQPPPKVLVCNVVVAYRSGVMDRVCWAGNPVNEGVTTTPFRMESLKAVARVMQQGDWMFSFDLKKGYFQIPLKEQFREFTYMRIGERYFRWNVLMFGLSTAPRDFSLIIKKVLKLLRKQGIRCCFFIDDIIFFAKSYQEACHIRQQALDLFYTLGFRVSWPKSLLQPGTIIRHLGLDVCSVDASLWAPEDKIMRVKQSAVELLQGSANPVPGRTVATFIGVLGALRLAIPSTLILSRGLMRTLSQLPELYDKVVHEKHWRVRDYDAVVQLSQLAIAELRFWVEGCWKIRGVRVKEVAHNVCFVDACPEGAGAVVARRLPGGAGEQWDIEQLRAGAWEERMTVTSTAFELLNIWNVVAEFKESWANGAVQVCSDNVGAVFITSKGCMRNSCLHTLSLGIWRMCWEHKISLCTQYIGGDGIIAAGADGLSRDSDYGDCRLKRCVFAQLWEVWHMEIDLFSSPTSRQYHPYTGEPLLAVSPYYCERRVGVDGLTFTSSRVMFAFPPSALLAALIPRAIKLQLRMVVVVPQWKETEWWPLVASLPTIECGMVSTCVLAGEAGITHPFGPSFDKHEAMNTILVAKAFNL
jgi:Reverse transcriptase (RNA-dependent DNA polymerase)